jgi:hypothetical protein
LKKKFERRQKKMFCQKSSQRTEWAFYFYF